jgi:hypothetical protein
MFFNLDQTEIGLTRTHPGFYEKSSVWQRKIYAETRFLGSSRVSPKKKPQVAAWGENNREKSMSDLVKSGENSDIPS